MKSDKWQRRNEIISNFTKRDTFLISYKNQLLFEVSHHVPSFSPNLLSGKRPSSPPPPPPSPPHPTPQFWQVENSHGQSFEKEEFTDLF